MKEGSRKERELPPSMHITVADDDTQWRVAVVNAVQELNSEYQIEAPMSMQDLFDRALYREPFWIPTDVVLLDNTYIKDSEKWSLTHLSHTRQAMQKMRDIGFDPIQLRNIYENRPCAYSIALFLRMRGFKGRIFSVSSEMQSQSDLNKYLQHTRTFEPILNGAILKNRNLGNTFFDRYSLAFGKINTDPDQVRGKLEDALRILLLTT